MNWDVLSRYFGELREKVLTDVFLLKKNSVLSVAIFEAVVMKDGQVVQW